MSAEVRHSAQKSNALRELVLFLDGNASHQIERKIAHSLHKIHSSSRMRNI